MMKLLGCAALAMLCLALPAASGMADAPVVNLIANPNAEFAFEEDAPILEIVFPRVYSSDCTLICMEDETMMVDASTESPVMQGRIATAMDAIGMDRVDIAYNSHPHRDHINGFEVVNQTKPNSSIASRRITTGACARPSNTCARTAYPSAA